MLLFVDTGLRVSELTGLKVDDVNLERRTLKVWGKGARERAVPFGVRSQKALLRYYNFHRAEPATPLTREFFLTDSGQPLKARRVQAIIKHYGEKAGIKNPNPRLKHIIPLMFRHTVACHLKNKCFSTEWIRNFLEYAFYKTARDI